MPRSRRFTPGKIDPVTVVHEAVWAPAPVWTGAENVAPTGIRAPDRPARSESLYCCLGDDHYTVGIMHMWSYGTLLLLLHTSTGSGIYNIAQVNTVPCRQPCPEVSHCHSLTLQPAAS
jgi:hypothetical protein